MMCYSLNEKSGAKNFVGMRCDCCWSEIRIPDNNNDMDWVGIIITYGHGGVLLENHYCQKCARIGFYGEDKENRERIPD